MQALILTETHYQAIISKLQVLENKVDAKAKDLSEQFLDNEEFIKLMKISKGTAQTWRDKGIIGFSQIGNKIYYRISDIEQMLDENHKTPFN